MIPQYTAASIVSQNKQYATPSSVDSIESSNGQEDHVSMGANGATKCKKVIDNIQTVLAIELFTALPRIVFWKIEELTIFRVICKLHLGKDVATSFRRIESCLMIS